MVDIRYLPEDERRQRDEARLKSLESQVEQLRHLLNEGAGRQATTDVGRLRAEVEELDQRLSSAVVLIPHVQAQISELGTQMHARFEELGQDRHRFGELQAQIDRLSPQVERSAEIARNARDEVATLRTEIDTIRKDWQKVGDSVGMVEQDVRRRVGDMATRVQEADERLDRLKGQLPPLEAEIVRVRQELHQALPKFDQFAKADVDLQESVDRVAAIDFDRHTQTAKKVEEVREVLEERVKLVERLNDTRFGSTMARFRELEEADRSIGHRITLLAVRLDELRDQDATIRLEMRRLEEMRLRVRLEQAQQEAATFTERLAQMQAELNEYDDDEEA